MKPRHLSIAGKGGTGKTTTASLLIRWLIREGRTPVLAVDADPNANLGEALGLEMTGSIADILAATKTRGEIPEGMSKDMFVEYRLSAALTESTGVDMLVMGGPEGPGCYCYPNDVLKRYVERLSSNYRWLVMDNEAGLEHLSRRIATDIDILLISSDPTVRGIRSAGRIAQLARTIGIDVGAMYLIVTRADPETVGGLADTIRDCGLELAGIIPSDPAIAAYDLTGRPLVELPDSSPASRAIDELATRLGL